MSIALVSRVTAAASERCARLGRVERALRLQALPLLRRALAAVALLSGILAASMAVADAPQPVEFPNTGAYTAKLQQMRRNVAVVEINGDYSRTLAGKTNAEPRTVIAREFLRHYTDKYDFLVAFSTFEFETGDAQAFYMGIRNDTRGLGQDLFDYSREFGSQGVLQGFIDMAALTRYTLSPSDARFERVMEVLSHEMLHRWGVRVKYLDGGGQPNAGLLGRDGSHWSFLLDTGGSVEYGNRWVDNGNGSFTSRPAAKHYSALDLYLMGMLKKEEVPPFFLIRNPDISASRLNEAGVTITGAREDITIDQVIAANGPRVPDSVASQKQFRLGFILLTRPGEVPTDDQILQVSRVQEAFQDRLAAMSGGRALAQTFIEPRGLAQAADPTLPTTPGGTPGATADVAKALTWLRLRQGGAGTWADHPLTEVRDTAVVATALAEASQAPEGVQAARGWLAQQTLNNSDYIARRVLALGALAAPQDWSTLAARQNADGGWGLATGYRSTPLDTALAMSAFAQDADSARKARVVALARQFLLSRQNTDGGWSPTPGGASRTATTTQVMRALVGQNADAPLLAAARFLSGRQNADGGFGDSPSTTHDTANVMMTLAAIGQVGQVRAGDAFGYLGATQRPDGSWDDSAYATGLSTRALAVSQAYNWIAETFVAAPDAVRDGQRIALQLNVGNAGNLAAPATTLRIFDGDPQAGSVVAELAVPPLAAGQNTVLRASWSTLGRTGTHTLTAVVDPAGAGNEMTRGDNVARTRVVVAAASAQADLQVTAADLLVTPAAVNRLPSTVSVLAQVANIGGTDATQVKVRLLAGPSANQLAVVDERLVTLLGRSSVPVNLSYDVTRPGRQALAVVVDPDGAQVDIDRGNNRADAMVETQTTFDPAVAQGDLVVPSTPVPQGADVVLKATVHNFGTADSPPFAAAFYVVDGQQEQLIDNSFIQLPAGGSRVFSLPWRVDRAGALKFRVRLDASGAVSDLDPDNNVADAPFTATPPAQGPNLTIGFRDLTISPDPAAQGLPLTMTAIVRNTGNQAAGAFEVAFYDRDPAQGGTLLGPLQPVAPLAAGASATVSLTLAAVDGAAPRLLFVVADAANRVAETDRTDNTAFREIAVLPLADLAVSGAGIVLTPAQPRPDEATAIAVTVQNLGGQEAVAVKVRLFDGTTALGERTLDRVPAHGSGVASFSATFSGDIAAHSLTAIVDPEGTVADGDRGNNSATRQLAVQNGPVSISDAYFSPNGDGIKDVVDFGFRSTDAAPVARVVVLDTAGRAVRTINVGAQTQGSVRWNGLDDADRIVFDGAYRLQAQTADGRSIGEVGTVLDTNRTPILAASGTPAEMYRPLSCRIRNIFDWTTTLDEQSLFVYGRAGGDEGVFRLGVLDGEQTQVLAPSFIQGTLGGRLTQLSAAARGDWLATVRRVGNGDPEAWVVRGDGAALTRVFDGADADEVSAMTLSHDGSTLFAHLVLKDGRDVLRRHVLSGAGAGTTTVLFDSRLHGDETIRQLWWAPNRRRVLLQIGDITKPHLMLLDLESGVLSPAPADFYQSGRWWDVRMSWSPDSRYVVLYGTVEDMGVEAGNNIDYQFDVFDPAFKVVNRFRTTLGVEAGSPELGGKVSPVEWTSDSLEIVFAHEAAQYGGDGQGINPQRGLYRGRVEQGTLTRAAMPPAAWSEGMGLWMAPGDRRAITGGTPFRIPVQYHVVDVDSGAGARVFESWFDGQSNPSGQDLSLARFTPSGRRLLFTSNRDAFNSQSSCYQEEGGPQLFAYESLQNLTADLQVLRDARAGGLAIAGTASDLNFASYQLQYADVRTPAEWHAIALPSTVQKLGERLTVWVPPAYGSYLVRLQAQDRAGNVATAQRRINWNDSPPITSLKKDLDYFSPNGDGVKDVLKLSYDVLEPVHLAFEVLNSDGVRVRLVERDHASIGSGHVFEWDGRDDRGRFVADDKYTLRVLDFEFQVVLDTVAPQLTLDTPDHSLDYRPGMPPEVELRKPWPTGPQDRVGLTVAPSAKGYLRVVDAAGRLVRDLLKDSADGGKPVAKRIPEGVQWSGDNDNGQAVAPGTYFVEIEVDEQSYRSFSAEVTRVNGVQSVQLRVIRDRVSPIGGAFGLSIDEIMLDESSITIEAGQGPSPSTWIPILKDRREQPLDGLRVDKVGDYQGGSLAVSGSISREAFAETRLRVTVSDLAGNESILTSPYRGQRELILLEGTSTMLEQDADPSQQRGGLVRSSADFMGGLVWLMPTATGPVPMKPNASVTSLTLNFFDNLPTPSPRTELRYAFVPLDLKSATPQALPLSGLAEQLGWTTVPLLGALEGESRGTVTDVRHPEGRQHETEFSWKPPAKSQEGAWLLQMSARDAEGVVHRSNIHWFAKPAESGPVIPRFDWDAYHEPALECGARPTEIGHVELLVHRWKKPLDSTLNPPLQPPVDGVRILRSIDGRDVGEPLLERNITNLSEGVKVEVAFSTADWPLGKHEFAVYLRSDGIWYRSQEPLLWVNHAAPKLDVTSVVEGQRMCASRITRSVGDSIPYVQLEVRVDEPYPAHIDVQRFVKNAWQFRGPIGASGTQVFGGASVSVPFTYVPPQPVDPICNASPRIDGTCDFSGPVTSNALPGTLRRPNTLKLFGLNERAEVEPLGGQVEARVRVYGPSGHLVCRPVTLDVDGEVLATVDIVDALISPNGDGRKEQTTLTISAQESVTARIRAVGARATETGLKPVPDSVLRTVIERLSVDSGTGAAVWDGRDDQGRPVADGEYFVEVQLQDGCGNIKTEYRQVSVDATPPVIVVDTPRPNSRLALETTVLGSVSDDHPLRYEIGVLFDGESQPRAFPRLVGMNTPLAPMANITSLGHSGPATLIVHAYDDAGNEGELRVPVEFAPPGDLIARLDVSPDAVSPNGDGRRDSATFSYRLTRDVRASLTIRNSANQVLRTLFANAARSGGDAFERWDGLNDQRSPVADQEVTAVLLAEVVGDGGVVLAQQEELVRLQVDRTAPLVTVLAPTAPVTRGIVPARVKIEDPLLTDARMEFAVNGGPSTVVAELHDASGLLEAPMDVLPEGPATLRVTAQDRAGNMTTLVRELIVDRTPPRPVLTAPLAKAVVSGRRLAVQTIEGTIEEAHLASYKLSIGDRIVTTATALPTPPNATLLGTWEPLQFADGPTALTLRTEDQAGQVTEISQPLIVDNTPPSAALRAVEGQRTLRVGSQILGTAADANLQSFRLELSAGGVSTGRWNELGRGTAAVQDGVLLTATALPADGLYGLRLTVIDQAGNESVVTEDVRVDTAPPSAVTLSGESPNNRDVALSWTAAPEADVAGYVLTRNGSRVGPVQIADTRYTDLAAPAGSHGYVVRAVDRSGNESAASNEVRVLITTSEPVAQIYLPLRDGYAAGLADVRGTATAAADFKEYRLSVGIGAVPSSWTLLRRSSLPITADQLAAWNTVGLIEGGVYTLRLEVENLIGRTAVDTVTVKVKNKVPSPALSLTGSANGNAVSLSWQVSQDADVQGYLVYRDQRIANASGVVVGSLVPYLVRATAHVDVPVADGLHRYVVVAMDQAGNVSEPSNEVQLRIDTRPPHLTLTSPADGAKVSQVVTLTAESPDSDLATVQFQFRPAEGGDWAAIGTPITRASGPWTASWSTNGLTLGEYQVRALGTDEGGKVDPSPAFATVHVTDLRKPEPATTLRALAHGGEVRLSWQASASDYAAGYHVERVRLDDSGERLTAEPQTGTSYVDADRDDGEHRYRVVAVSRGGTESAPSNLATTTVFTPAFDQPYTPTGEVATALAGRTRADQRVILSNIAGDAIAEQRSDAEGRYRFETLALAQGDNRFKLIVRDDAGNTSREMSWHARRGPLPVMPQGLSAQVAEHRVDLSWTANPEPDLLGYVGLIDGAARGGAAPRYAATASSSAGWPYNSDPSQAIDDNEVSGWRPGYGPVAGQWLEVGLGVPRLVDRFDLVWADPSDIPTRVRLEGFDGEVWVPLAERRNTDDALKVVVPLPQPYLTDRVRMTIVESTTESARLNELRIHAVELIAAGSTATSFPDVADGRPRVGLRAVSPLGLAGPVADTQVTVGDVTPPQAPVLSAQINGADVILSWTLTDDADVRHFRIERDGAIIATLEGGANRSYLDPALPNGRHLYRVIALDGVGNASPPSNAVEAEVAVAGPGAPITLSAIAAVEGGRVALSWTVGDGAQPTRFELRRGTTAGGPYEAVAGPLDGGSRSRDDDSVVNGTRYYYLLVGQDSGGRDGARSNEVTVRPDDRVAPATPYFVLPGRSPGPVTTNASALQLVGYGEPGSRIVLSRDGVDFGTVTASIDAEWRSFYQNTSERVFDATPDGSLIYFRGETQALYQADGATVDSPALTQLKRVRALRLAPDGQSAAILRQGNDGVRLSRWTRADDRIADLPLAAIDGPMTFSPDGTTLALMRMDEQGGAVTVLMDWRTGTSRDLPREASGLAFSPDGRTLALAGGQSLVLVDVAQGGETRVIGGLNVPRALSWLPDGRALLVENYGTNFVSLISRVDVDSGVVTRLTDPDTFVGYSGPAVAPDGSGYLAFRGGYQLVQRDFAGNEQLIDYASDGAGAPRWTQSGNQVFLRNWNELAAILPAGQFRFDQAALKPGSQSFGAYARDAAGNGSTPALELEVRRVSETLPDWAIEADSWQVYPATPQAGEAVTVALTVRNLGAAAPATTVRVVALDSQGNAQTLFSGPVAALVRNGADVLRMNWTPRAAGRQLLVASVDPLAQVEEQSESNNLTSREIVVVAQADRPTLEVVADKREYAAGETVAATVNVAYAGAGLDGRLVLRVADAGGLDVVRLPARTVTGLRFGAPQRFSFTWPSGTTLAGAYRLVAELADDGGAVLGSGETGFELLSGARLEASVITDRVEALPGETVSLRGVLRFASGNVASLDAPARLVVRRQGSGEVVARRDEAISGWLPGADVRLDLGWTATQTGDYEAEISAGPELAPTAKATTAFRVVPPTAPVLQARLQAVTDVVTSAESVRAQYSVSNRGAAVDPLPVRVSAVNPVTGALLSQWTGVLPGVGALPVTGAAMLQGPWPLGSFELRLEADGGAGWTVLSKASVRASEQQVPGVGFVRPMDEAVVRSDSGALVQAVARQNTVDRVEFRLGEGPWTLATPQATETDVNRYAAALPAQEGPALLIARAFDSQGNVSTEVQRRIVIDNTAPVIVIGGVTDGGSYAAAVTPTVAVTEPHPGTVTTMLDGQPFVSGTTVSASGNHRLNVVAVDAAGNRSETAVAFSISISTGNPPTLKIIYPSTGGVVQDELVISAYAYAGASPVARAELRVDDGAPVPMVQMVGTPTNFWIGTTTATDGPHVFGVRAVATDGQVSAWMPVTIVIDTTAPVIAFGGVTEGAHYTGTVTPTVTITEPNPKTSTVLLDGAAYTPGTPITSSGAHTLTVTATDVLGHKATATVRFTVDAVPQWQLTWNVPAFPGQVLPASTIYSSLSLGKTNASLYGSTNGGAWTPWPYGPRGKLGAVLPLEDGVYQLKAYAQTPDGMRSEITESWMIIDRTQPVIRVSNVSEGSVHRGAVHPIVQVTEQNPDKETILLDGAPFQPGSAVTATGSHTLSIEAIDKAGNVARRTVTFTIEAAPATPLFTVAEVAKPRTLLVYVRCAQKLDDTGNICLDEPGGRQWDPQATVESCSADRAAWLRGYLLSAGIEAEVVSDEANFLRLLRTGSYGTYWLGGGGQMLSTTAIGELEAAVRRGDGLLTEGWRPNRHPQLQDLGGIRYLGELADVPRVFDHGMQDLPSMSLNVLGGVSLGTASADVSVQGTMSDGAGTAPGMVVTRIGRRDVLALGFDLTATLRRDAGTESRWAVLLRALLDRIRPQSVEDNGVQGIAELRYVLTSSGTPSQDPVDVVSFVPSGIRVTQYRPTDARVSEAGGMTQVTWRTAAGQAVPAEFRIQLALPDTTTTYSVPATATVVRASGTELGDAVTLTLRARGGLDLIDEAITVASRLTSPSVPPPPNPLLSLLTLARMHYVSGHMDDALRNLQAAQRQQWVIKGADQDAFRELVARAIEVVEKR